MDCPPCGDRCRPAVCRCYQGLIALGQPVPYAFEAALEVFRWHHPEVAMPDAELQVTVWVAGGIRQ